jgi:hypothetical protein
MCFFFDFINIFTDDNDTEQEKEENVEQQKVETDEEQQNTGNETEE